MDIKRVKKEAEKEIIQSKDLEKLDHIFRKYLGKKGEITQILRSIKDLPEKEKKETGKSANQLKREIESMIREKKEKVSVSSDFQE